MRLSHFQIAVMQGIVNNGGAMHKVHIPSRTRKALVKKRALRERAAGWCELTIGGDLALAGHALGRERRVHAA